MGFKKISTFNGIILALFSIFSCSKNNDFLASNDIFISEYFVGSFFKNSAIEIVNNTNKDIYNKIKHLDSIKDAKVIEVKSLDNDSTLRLFYQLIGK